jgi:folate-binding protein YgfZ
LRTCGTAAVEAARIAAGAPLWGREITDTNLPQELNRDAKLISFTKGCYLGQETVARIDALGHVNRLLVGLRAAGKDVPAIWAELQSEDGKAIGAVTSATFSHRLGGAIALGYVRRALAVPGSVVQSAVGPLTVTALPMA